MNPKSKPFIEQNTNKKYELKNRKIDIITPPISPEQQELYKKLNE